MFRTVPLSITRTFHCTHNNAMCHTGYSYSLRAGSGRNFVPSWSWSQVVSKTVWHIPLLCVQWKTPGDGQRNCPKHVDFYSKNKFEKLVHLFGFIIRICHDKRSPEQQNKITLCGKTEFFFPCYGRSSCYFMLNTNAVLTKVTSLSKPIVHTQLFTQFQNRSAYSFSVAPASVFCASFCRKLKCTALECLSLAQFSHHIGRKSVK